MNGGGASVGNDRRIVSEQQLLHVTGISRQAIDRQVRLGGLGGHQALLGLADAIQDGGGALGILVDPHTQIDLVRVRIFF